MGDKKTILTVGDVRIKEYDNANVVTERYEDVFIPKERQTAKRWVFKGYSRGVLSALLLIQRKELLIEATQVNDLDGYLKQVQESNEKLTRAVDGVGI